MAKARGLGRTLMDLVAEISGGPDSVKIRKPKVKDGPTQDARSISEYFSFIPRTGDKNDKNE